jgi:hypothetical protein
LALQKGIGIGYAGRNEDFVVFVLESKGEGQYAVLYIFLDSVLIALPFVVIDHVVSSGLPVLSGLTTAHIGLHASLEEGVDLLEAIDMQFDCGFGFVLHAEVKPLAVAVGI